MKAYCQIGHSSFPEECIFHLTLGDDNDHIGAAPREDCFTRAGQPLAPGHPLPGQTVAGLVAVRVIGRQGEDGVLVSLPDGAVVVVRKDRVRPSSSGRKGRYAPPRR
jgi:hypothetical protein